MDDSMLSSDISSLTTINIQGGQPEDRTEMDRWEYADKGIIERDDSGDFQTGFTQHFIELQHEQLGQIPATAISGNDITSSCLYVAGLSAVSAGKFAPISLALVAVVLWLFKGVYSEVGAALPLNGGAYNVLLNTTSKLVAAMAACLTLLSYVATAVVSGSEAVAYANYLYDEIKPIWATVLLLFFFCVLNLVGISESSVVASIIFAVHCTTLVILIVLSAVEAFKTNWVMLVKNWETDPIISVSQDIFFGFCSGLLGVSGFETSANFIEEQKPGVFPQTLRNMWIAVAFFNPIISLLSMALIPLSEMKNISSVVLSEMGRRAAGKWLAILVSADAALVLSGAVLTAYVGVIGLMRRMALDRLLPKFLLDQNKWRRTNHWIILLFFFITSSLFLIVFEFGGGADKVQSTLAGVYTVSFLSVMALFGIGNLLLKYKRRELPREYKTFWGFTVIAIISVAAALVGNIMASVSVLVYFSAYFLVTVIVVGIMMARIRILRFIYSSATQFVFLNNYFGDWLKYQIKEIQDSDIVFFTRRGKLSVLNKAILYIRENELTDRIKVIHCYEGDEDIPPKLVSNVKIMDRCYPKTTIDLLMVRGKFSPSMVHHLSEKLHIPKNFMFLTCPNGKFPNNIAEFGGVRLITH